MTEIKRVLLGRKSLTLLWIVWILHGIFFFYQCNNVKQETLSDEALASYVSGYSAYLEEVVANADEMLENPLFSNSGTYVYRNLVKTRADFASLLSVTPVYGENRGIMTAIPYQLTGYVLLLMGIYYVLCFMAERQKGLYLLVRCTYQGRFCLSLQRICTLLLGIFGCGCLFFLSILPIFLLRFPGSDLSRPIQSIPEFSGVLSHVSIGGYLCILALRRILGCIVTCMLLYFCMSLLRSTLCVVLFLGLFFCEYLLYALLLPTDQLCILKYVNLYTLIFHPQDYAHYYNVNLFGYPRLTGSCSDAVAIGAFVVFSLLCLWQFTRQYPKAEGNRFPLFDRIAALWSRKKPLLTPFLWECKKILFSQKALWILLFFIYLAWSSSNEVSYRDWRSIYVVKWYHTYEGPITEKKLNDIEKQKEKLENKLERLEASLKRQNELMEEYSQKGYETFGVESNIGKLQAAISEYQRNIRGISQVQEHALANAELSKKRGIPVDLLDPACYEMLLSMDYQTVQKNYLYVLLAIIFACSGVMSRETSSNMKPTLRVLYKGRWQLLIRKLLIVLALSAVCALSIHLVQYFQIGRVIPYHSPDAIAQSIPCLRYLPVLMTIRTYIIFLFIFRVLIAFLLGVAVMAISHYGKSRSNTIALSIFLLAIPMVLLSYFFLAIR